MWTEATRAQRLRNMARYRGRIAGAHQQCCERDLPGGMYYVERICERVAWRACDRVRSLCEVREGGFEVLQQLFIRLCM